MTTNNSTKGIDTGDLFKILWNLQRPKTQRNPIERHQANAAIRTVNALAKRIDDLEQRVQTMEDNAANITGMADIIERHAEGLLNDEGVERSLCEEIAREISVLLGSASPNATSLRTALRELNNAGWQAAYIDDSETISEVKSNNELIKIATENLDECWIIFKHPHWHNSEKLYFSNMNDGADVFGDWTFNEHDDESDPQNFNVIMNRVLDLTDTDK